MKKKQPENVLATQHRKVISEIKLLDKTRNLKGQKPPPRPRRRASEGPVKPIQEAGSPPHEGRGAGRRRGTGE